jgi:hypothetical protein
MDGKMYYGSLLKFRGGGVRFCSFVGRRWFCMMGLLLVFPAALVWMDEPVTRGLSLIMLGYALGAGARDVRSYFTSRRFWAWQKEVLNWEKIETLSKEVA